MTRTPVQLVEEYIFELYHEAQVDRVHDLCADPIVRHEPRRVVKLSRAQQIARIRADLETNRPRFTIVNLAGDEQFATLTWNVVRLANGEELCGIEVFKAADGLITDVWNSNYFEGSWA